MGQQQVPNPQELLEKLEEAQKQGMVSREIVSQITKEALNQVKVITADASKPLTPDNAQVYLNGKLLPLVKGVKLELDSEKALAIVRLDLYAHFTVEEAPRGPASGPAGG